MYIELFLAQAKGAWHLAEDKGVSSAEIAELRLARNVLYSQLLRTERTLIDGVKETLANLHGKFVMGIVTGSRKDHFELIHQSTNVLPYFDFVLTSDDYTKSKPEPEPYIFGLQKIGVAKEACLVVEDSGRGLASAKSAGLRCVVVPNELTKGSDFSETDQVLKSITEVARALLA
jgi:HAD superfamily hydrolase (TIGR01509 family)